MKAISLSEREPFCRNCDKAHEHYRNVMAYHREDGWIQVYSRTLLEFPENYTHWMELLPAPDACIQAVTKVADDMELALAMSRLVHDECKDVPHDIGLRLFELVRNASR